MKRMMIAMMLFVTMVTPNAAHAAPRCPNGGTATPHGCTYELPGMTCAWPFRLVKVGKVALCVKWEKVQQ